MNTHQVYKRIRAFKVLIKCAQDPLKQTSFVVGVVLSFCLRKKNSYIGEVHAKDGNKSLFFVIFRPFLAILEPQQIIDSTSLEQIRGLVTLISTFFVISSPF